MRIRHKIFIGYMALIAVSVALVVVFLLSLSAINSSYGDLLGSKEQALLQANNLRYSVERETVAARTYEEFGEPGQLAEFEQAIRAQDQAMNLLAPLIAGRQDAQVLQEVQSARANYTTLTRRSIDLARAGKQDALVALNTSEIEPARMELVNACDRLIGSMSNDVALSQAALSSQVNEASARLLLEAVIGILAALLAATLLTEGLTSPLRRLMRKIQGISSGDLQTAITTDSKDEIGELAGVLETMRERLAQAAAQNAALRSEERRVGKE